MNNQQYYETLIGVPIDVKYHDYIINTAYKSRNSKIKFYCTKGKLTFSLLPEELDFDIQNIIKSIKQSC